VPRPMPHKPTPETLENLFPSQAAGTTPTSLRLSSALLVRLDAIAKARSVTRTAVVEKLLTFALEQLGDDSVEELQARRRRAGNVRVSVTGKKI
jgi:predicted transcriptional regulator